MNLNRNYTKYNLIYYFDLKTQSYEICVPTTMK